MDMKPGMWNSLVLAGRSRFRDLTSGHSIFKRGVVEWSTVGTGAALILLSKQVHNSTPMWTSSRQ